MNQHIPTEKKQRYHRPPMLLVLRMHAMNNDRMLKIRMSYSCVTFFPGSLSPGLLCNQGTQIEHTNVLRVDDGLSESKKDFTWSQDVREILLHVGVCVDQQTPVLNTKLKCKFACADFFRCHCSPRAAVLFFTPVMRTMFAASSMGNERVKHIPRL